MQAVANANKAGKAIHVFGAVADPFSAGIGLNRDNPMEHPRHLTGIGTFMPVAANFQLARRRVESCRIEFACVHRESS